MLVLLDTNNSNGKDKGHPGTGQEGPEWQQIYNSTIPSTSALDGDEWSTPRPRKDPVPII